MSKKIIRDMRRWVEDCAVNDDDLYDREQASDSQIVTYVSKNYHGGIDQFIKDGE